MKFSDLFELDTTKLKEGEEKKLFNDLYEKVKNVTSMAELQIGAMGFFIGIPSEEYTQVIASEEREFAALTLTPEKGAYKIKIDSQPFQDDIIRRKVEVYDQARNDNKKFSFADNDSTYDNKKNKINETINAFLGNTALYQDIKAVKACDGTGIKGLKNIFKSMQDTAMRRELVKRVLDTAKNLTHRVNSQNDAYLKNLIADLKTKNVIAEGQADFDTSLLLISKEESGKFYSALKDWIDKYTFPEGEVESLSNAFGKNIKIKNQSFYPVNDAKLSYVRLLMQKHHFADLESAFALKYNEEEQLKLLVEELLTVSRDFLSAMPLKLKMDTNLKFGHLVAIFPITDKKDVTRGDGNQQWGDLKSNTETYNRPTLTVDAAGATLAFEGAGDEEGFTYVSRSEPRVARKFNLNKNLFTDWKGMENWKEKQYDLDLDSESIDGASHVGDDGVLIQIQKVDYITVGDNVFTSLAKKYEGFPVDATLSNNVPGGYTAFNGITGMIYDIKNNNTSREWKSLYVSGSSDHQTCLVCSENYSGGGGGSGIGRADPIAPEYYVWRFVGNPDLKETILRGLDLDATRELRDTDKESTFEKTTYVGTKGDTYVGTKGELYIKVEKITCVKYQNELYVKVNTPEQWAPSSSGMKTGMASEMPFQINYYRKAIEVDGSLRIVKPVDEGRNRPRSKDKLHVENGKKYVVMNCPVGGLNDLGGRADHRADVQSRPVIKNKGENLFSSTKKRINAGAVMCKIASDFKVTVRGPSNSLPATNMCEAIFDQEDSKAKIDWNIFKQNHENRLPTDQEWCHLRGHGDGGDERLGNFVSGSVHCNTEQLAIEMGQRVTTHKASKKGEYILHSTAYLLRDDSMANTIPALYGDLHKKSKSNEKVSSVDIEDSSAAPIAAFIRYKVYRNKEDKNAKLFDYTFEGQSEFFDRNQFKILNATVRYVLEKAQQGGEGSMQVEAQQGGEGSMQVDRNPAQAGDKKRSISAVYHHNSYPLMIEGSPLKKPKSK